MTGAVLDKAARVDISFTDNKNRGGARYRAALGFLMGVERTRQMMKIGFIGTGNMGGALARAAAKGGHTLLLANRTPAKAEVLAKELGGTVCQICHITDPLAKGLALGTSAHAIGTSKALQMGEIEGAMSGLAIAVAGIMTAILAPVVANFLP